MSAELALAVGPALVAVLFAYIGFNFAEQHGEIKSFYIAISQLFGGSVLYNVAVVADQAGYTGISQVTWKVVYAWIFVFVIYIFYLIIMYFKDTIHAAVNGEWRWNI